MFYFVLLTQQCESFALKTMAAAAVLVYQQLARIVPFWHEFHRIQRIQAHRSVFFRWKRRESSKQWKQNLPSNGLISINSLRNLSLDFKKKRDKFRANVSSNRYQDHILSPKFLIANCIFETLQSMTHSIPHRIYFNCISFYRRMTITSNYIKFEWTVIREGKKQTSIALDVNVRTPYSVQQQQMMCKIYAQIES